MRNTKFAVSSTVSRERKFLLKRSFALALRRVGGVRVAQIVVEENTRVGEAEAVDALLDVADGERFFPSREMAEKMQFCTSFVS